MNTIRYRDNHHSHWQHQKNNPDKPAHSLDQKLLLFDQKDLQSGMYHQMPQRYLWHSRTRHSQAVRKG